jgi:hypothetical protein
MYVCMYVITIMQTSFLLYVCMYVSTFVCMFICMCMYETVSMSVCVYVCMELYMFDKCPGAYLKLYVCMYGDAGVRVFSQGRGEAAARPAADSQGTPKQLHRSRVEQIHPCGCGLRR